jgi:hypothetical protein
VEILLWEKEPGEEIALEETEGTCPTGKRTGEGIPPGRQGNKHRLKVLPLRLLVPKEKL